MESYRRAYCKNCIHLKDVSGYVECGFCKIFNVIMWKYTMACCRVGLKQGFKGNCGTTKKGFIIIDTDVEKIVEHTDCVLKIFK